MEAARKVLGEDRLGEVVFPPFRRRFALLEEDGSGCYGFRVGFRVRELQTPKNMVEVSYKLLSGHVSASLGESAIPSVSFDTGAMRWTFSGSREYIRYVDDRLDYEEYERGIDCRSSFIELRLMLLCGGEEALRNAVCVVEDAGAEVRKRYEWDETAPWKFFARR